MNTQKQIAKILLDIKAVSLNPQKPFRYTSGILSPVYTDCRLLISYPAQRKEVIQMYVSAIEKQNINVDIVAGTATAGIAHAAWIADVMNLPMVYVRGSAKSHGKGNQIEGLVAKGQHAIVIEDLISTGGSSVESAKALRNAKAQVSHIFSIITYGMQKAEETFAHNALILISLTNFETVVQVAVDNGYIKENDKEVILGWIQDPAGWGKKMGFE